MNIINKLFGENKKERRSSESLALKYKEEIFRLRKEVEHLRIENTILRRSEMSKFSQGKANNKSESQCETINDFIDRKEKVMHKINSDDKKDTALVFLQENKVKEENIDQKESIDKFQTEYASMQSLYNKIGEEMTDLRKQIFRMKISLSLCQKQYKDDNKLPQVNKETTIIELGNNVDK